MPDLASGVGADGAGFRGSLTAQRSTDSVNQIDV
jgi:hypothetical protein